MYMQSRLRTIITRRPHCLFFRVHIHIQTTFLLQNHIPTWGNWFCIHTNVLYVMFCNKTSKTLKTKKQENLKQENAIRCNSRDDLLKLSFTLEISVFSEAYI